MLLERHWQLAVGSFYNPINQEDNRHNVAGEGFHVCGTQDPSLLGHPISSSLRFNIPEEVLHVHVHVYDCMKC